MKRADERGRARRAADFTPQRSALRLLCLAFVTSMCPSGKGRDAIEEIIHATVTRAPVLLLRRVRISISRLPEAGG